MIARRLAALHVILTVLLCACSSTTPYYKALTVAGELVNEAPSLMEAYDKHYQDGILTDLAAGKITVDDAKSKVIAYRTKRNKAEVATTDLQNLVVAGKSILALVDSGARPFSDVAPYMVTVGAAVLQLKELLADLGVKVP